MAFDINGAIGRLTSAMQVATSSTSHNLLNQGYDILYGLVVVMVTYHLVMTFVGEDWAMTQVSLMQMLLKWAVVSFMLGNWTFVGSFFVDGFSDLARQASGSSATPSAFFKMGTDAIMELFSVGKLTPSGEPCTFVGCQNPTSTIPGTNPGLPAAMWDFMKGVASTALGLANIFLLIGALVFKVLAAVAISGMVTAAIAVSLLGMVAIGVGMTVGPIMLPFLLISSLSYLFDSWLRFMIAGGMIKVISAILLVFVGAAFKTLNDMAGMTTNGTEFGVDILVIFLIFIVASMSAYLMWQVPEFTNKLMNGQAVGNATGAVGGPVSKIGKILTGK